MINLEQESLLYDLTDEEKQEIASMRILKQYTPAFEDGNKRSGMHVMLAFLPANGIRLNCSNEDVVVAGLGVASGAMGYEGLLH